VIPWLKALGHIAVLLAVLAMLDWMGAQVNANTLAICIAIAALVRAYAAPSSPEKPSNTNTTQGENT
jgi:hypothetical protein